MGYTSQLVLPYDVAPPFEAEDLIYLAEHHRVVVPLASFKAKDYF